jgi:hypothetical protein
MQRFCIFARQHGKWLLADKFLSVWFVNLLNGKDLKVNYES